MPWNEVNTVDLRREFVAMAQHKSLSFSDLCARYNISRKTGYKWLNRYSKQGSSGLEDRSRCPRHQPRRTPDDIERLILETRKGELLTNEIIREKLAREKNVQATDPMTIGIFLRIIAEAAEEERLAKKKKIAPYWRVLKPDGAINVKLPGGAERQIELLESEGHRIEQGKGKKPPRVISFDKKLKNCS